MNIIKILQNQFPDIEIKGEKILVSNILETINFLKNSPELSFDALLTIIAVDYKDYIELIYPLKSTYLNEKINLSIKVQKFAESVTNIFNSAYFDECEIFDLFGINFINNKKLKRLFMPATWQGYPLKKDYIMNDERLAWNE